MSAAAATTALLLPGTLFGRLYAARGACRAGEAR